MDEELRYNIAITMFKGIGPRLINRLIEHFGSIESFFAEKNLNIEIIPDFGYQRAAQIDREEALAKADREIDFCIRNGVRIISHKDTDYPYRLLQCPDFPNVIYCKGDVNLNYKKILSIVGTRKSTLYGRNCCNEIVSELKARGQDVLIISGLAYGIDIAAHKAALESGLKTVGVVAHGLNQLYPSSHKNIAREMVENGGAILSDFSILASPEPQNFLKRNRIVAGLSDAILVVESAEKGGSMITASLGNSYNREVLAIPGKSTDKYSKGCNQLIKQNRASLVESASDIEYILSWDNKENIPQQLELPIMEMNTEETKVYDYLKINGSSSINDITNNVKIPINKLPSVLLSLELRGIIYSLPGSRYTIEV